LPRRKWITAETDKEKAARLASETGADSLAVLILLSRGYDTAEKIREFLDSTSLSDPFSLLDMDKAVARIRRALDEFERITVFGDYDADGVTATAILYSYLDIVGANADYVIPSREVDGYGLNFELIDKVKESGTKLIITVDNGINSFEEAEYIHSLGMDLIITDHHIQSGELPRALAVVDPHRTDETGQHTILSGAGVAFKLVCALEGEDTQNMLLDYADLLAIGTIADIVPICGENRALISAGLRCINETPRPAIEAIRESAGLGDKEFNSRTVAYTIAPRINAAGRMGSAESALRLLLSEDYEEAQLLTAALEKANKERLETEKRITDEIERMFDEDPTLYSGRVIVVSGIGWHPGVIGIVAARLCERYGKPSVVVSVDENNLGRASARSIEGFSIFEALKYCSGYLHHYGGHTLAAGFSIDADKIDAFREAIEVYARTVKRAVPTLSIDCRLNPKYIGNTLFDSLEYLEPFGAGNPSPVFGLFGMQIQAIRPVGNGHVRLQLSREETKIEAVRFGVSVDELPFTVGDRVDLAVVIEKNEYMGTIRPSIQIKDMRFAGTDDEALFDGLIKYEEIAKGENPCDSGEIDACPTRAFMENLFRFLKANGGWKYDLEILCYRLGLEFTEIARLGVALDALCELNLIYRLKSGGYAMVENPRKVELCSSRLLSSLGYSEDRK
jgi:single-stranded-DNA-specific exonuclease